jgi:DNA-binding transcriptional LysR family regulator
MDHDLFARQGLSLDRLRSFLLVATAGGMARAAPGEPARQSQLSRQIRELEGFFGHALIVRKGRGIALTPAGERLAGVVRETIEGLSDIAAEGCRAPTSLSLGAGDSVLHWWVIPRLGAALARAPGAAVTLAALSARDVVDRLFDARLDVGLLRRDALPDGLRGRPIGSLDYALFVPRRLLPELPRRRGGAPAASFEAMDERWADVPFALQHSEPELNEPLFASARRRGVELRPALACETFPQACRAVEAERYAALLPTLARADLPPSRFLEIQPSSLGRHTVKMRIVWHPRLERQRPAAMKLVDALEKGLHLGG